MSPTGVAVTLASFRPATDVAARAHVDAACARIAPAWPLDRLIAVNPYWGWIDRPIAEAAATLGATAGAPLLMPRAWYRAQRDAGRIPDAAIDRALVRHGAPMTRDGVLAALERDARALPQHPLVSDLCDAATRHRIATQLGKACEAYFDAAQASWPATDGLYTCWREHQGDAAADLPDSADALIAEALETLALPRAMRTTYLTALLLSVGGWAGAAAHRRWEARLRGGDDDTIVELLAVRLGHELMLFRAAAASDLPTRWAQRRRQWQRDAERVADDQAPEWILQRAFEIAHHERLAGALAWQPPASRGPAATVRAQAVFCIDVRSEAIRHHLEDAGGIETLGFAGSFGIALEHRPRGGAPRPYVPGLLAPAFVAEDIGHDAHGFTPALTQRCDGTALDADAKADLAATVLRGMSLTESFAPLVALIGHAALQVDDPQASALSCGACGGQSGEVNAKVAAALFNDRDVRARLAARGLVIPASTRFVGGLHDTSTDEIRLFPDATTAATHADALAALQAACAQASRRRRAPDRPVTRPEWGLSGNAALIVAPRRRTRSLDLKGRAFLHEYDAQRDPDHAVLEAILTAPVIIGHWINFQYWASTVDPSRFGSGDKRRHQVACGNLGVYDGAGGNLRIGLAMQSVHDGTRFVHEPMRLGVFIEAAAPAIDAVLAKHATIRNLVAHEWIFLYRIDPDTGAVAIRRPDGWESVAEAAARP